MIPIVLSVTSFILVGFGQPHISPVLSLLASSIGFAFFWLSLLKITGKKRRFIYGTLWFFGVQLIQLSWLASPTYQGNYIYFVYLGLAAWLGIQFGILSLFFPAKAPILLQQSFGIAALWTLMEWGRLYVLCGFPWNPVGLSMTAFSLGSQLAAVVGIFGLSFIVIMTNLLGVNAFTTRKKKYCIAQLGLLLFPYLFGLGHIGYHDRQKKELPPYDVALIQTSLLPDEKDLYPGKEQRYVHPLIQWKSLLGYIQDYGSQKLDLIVLPEYALPFGAYAMVYPLTQVKEILKEELGELDSLLGEKTLAEQREGQWFVSNAFLVQSLANHYRAEVVIGLNAKEEHRCFNAAFHFVPQGQKILRYEKRILLPLAEYLPFSFLKPLVATYGIFDFFSHGKEAKITQGKYPISLSICYEECFPHIMSQGREKGAQLFVNITNDGWYPHSHLPEQHFMHGRIRAIENGVPLLRACNTGVTAVVDSLGRTIARFQNDQGEFELVKGALYTSFPLYTFPTLYTLWGNSPLLILSTVSLLFLRKKRKKTPSS